MTARVLTRMMHNSMFISSQLEKAADDIKEKTAHES